MHVPTGKKQENRPARIDAVKKQVMRIVRESDQRLTRPALEKAVLRRISTGRKRIKSVIRSLVDDGELIYTYDYGCSFIEQSFRRPVRISRYVVLKPPEIDYPPEPGDIVVAVQPGASFGTGRHPSTRLAVRGIEYALKQGKLSEAVLPGCLLDIGTGSGILLITALLMGVRRGLGIDTDPCARAEALENVAINGLSDRATIENRDLADIDSRFTLIMANLRYPSLIQLSAKIAQRTVTRGVIVLSGVKTGELGGLKEMFMKRKFRFMWEAAEKGWAGMVMQKRC